MTDPRKIKTAHSMFKDLHKEFNIIGIQCEEVYFDSLRVFFQIDGCPRCEFKFGLSSFTLNTYSFSTNNNFIQLPRYTEMAIWNAEKGEYFLQRIGYTYNPVLVKVPCNETSEGNFYKFFPPNWNKQKCFKLLKSFFNEKYFFDRSDERNSLILIRNALIELSTFEESISERE